MGEARDSAMACYTPSTEVKFKKIMFPVFFFFNILFNFD